MRDRENEGVHRGLVLSEKHRDRKREGILIIYIVLLIWEKKVKVKLNDVGELGPSMGVRVDGEIGISGGFF